MTSTETEQSRHCSLTVSRLEQTAKGARVTVHVNANNGLEDMEQSINLYRATKTRARAPKGSSRSYGS